MIQLSNGHSFLFMTASGALAFDGRGWPWEWPLHWVGLLDPTLFTIVTKTLTHQPRRGNLRWSHPWSVVKPMGPTGVINAIGLTNGGIDWWLKEVAPKINPQYKIVVSIEADQEQDMVEMIELLKGQKIVAIELNLSCPNSGSEDRSQTDKVLNLCRVASQHTSFPLIAKLAYTHDYLEIVKGLDGTKVESISINSIPWEELFQELPSPLDRFGGGGISGKVIQPFTWKMVEEISKNSKIPVIGPSIWEYRDLQKVLNHGAQALSFGSVFVYTPWKPTLYARRWIREHLS